MSEHTRNQKRMYRIHKQEEKILEQELMIASLQQKVEQLEKEKDYLDDYNRHLHNENKQLENIRKEAIEYVTKKWYSKNTEDINKMVSFGNWEIDLLNILDKGVDKE